jgi:hypothetical protein
VKTDRDDVACKQDGGQRQQSDAGKRQQDRAGPRVLQGGQDGDGEYARQDQTEADVPDQGRQFATACQGGGRKQAEQCGGSKGRQGCDDRPCLQAA